jgi:hypothetical protein
MNTWAALISFLDRRSMSFDDESNRNSLFPDGTAVTHGAKWVYAGALISQERA